MNEKQFLQRIMYESGTEPSCLILLPAPLPLDKYANQILIPLPLKTTQTLTQGQL